MKRLRMINRKTAQSTLEFLVLFTAVVGILLIFLNPQSGHFGRALFSTLGMTTNGIGDVSSRISAARTMIGRDKDGNIVLMDSNHWTLDDLRVQTFDGSKISMEMVDGQLVFKMEGQVNVFTLGDLIDIDPNKKYKVSLDAMSEGEEGQAGRLFSGFVCYDEEGNIIRSYQAKRVGNEGKLAGFSQDGMTIITEGNLEGWQQDDVPPVNRLLGIYLDGDTSHLPDYVIGTEVFGNLANYQELNENLGAYQNTQDNEIHLNNRLPDDVMAAIQENSGTAVIMNHLPGHSYDYVLTPTGTRPELDSWTTYSVEVNGEAFNTSELFWTGTDSVQFVLLGNYRSVFDPSLGYTPTMYFKNFRMVEVTE